jgi:methyltransferase (TIGR00027 family)
MLATTKTNKQESSMTDKPDPAPDSTAARVALWRALHVEADPPPHVLEDEIGLKLLAPDEDWRRRGDMDPQFTRPFRASIVARARFIEDLVVEQAGRGLSQYVILGAGLDSFAQRRPEIASRLRVFEVDQPVPQAWKRQRLIELGFGVPDWLRFVPVDFEAGGSWREGLVTAGFDDSKPAIVVSTGVSMYLTKEANAATLREVAALAPGSTLAMTFLLPLELADPEVRPGLEMAEKGARASGTPFISFFTPPEIQSLAREAGFLGGGSHPALLCGQDRRSAPAEQCGGTAGGEYIAALTIRCGGNSPARRSCKG